MLSILAVAILAFWTKTELVRIPEVTLVTSFFFATVRASRGHEIGACVVLHNIKDGRFGELTGNVFFLCIFVRLVISLVSLAYLSN